MPFPVRKIEKVMLIKTGFLKLISHACSFSLHSLRITPMVLASCRKDFFFVRGGGGGGDGVILENNVKSSHFHQGKVQGQHSNIRIT